MHDRTESEESIDVSELRTENDSLRAQLKETRELLSEATREGKAYQAAAEAAVRNPFRL